MKEIMLTKRALDRLKEYELDGIISTESTLYYLKKYYDKPNVLLKKLFTPTDKIIDSKVRTIEEISSRKELQDIKELVIPENLVVLSGQAIGFSIQEIDKSTNLGIYLKRKDVPMKKKIEIVEKVGKIIERTTNLEKNFFFTDLHEFNFLIDENELLYAVDLDSSRVNSDEAISSKYLSTDKKLQKVNKYNVNSSGLAYPDKNSEIYCYNMMVLNLISNHKINRLRYDDYYEYLDFLYKEGVSEELLDPLSRMYTEQDNLLITSIENNIPKEKDISFEAHKKRLIK